jgi:hypothetical protein
VGLDPVRNFAICTVSQGYAAGVTLIALASGHGARLPQPSTDGAFNFVWWNDTDYPGMRNAAGDLDPFIEIGRCTVRTADILSTIVRAQEGTSDVDHNISGKTYKILLSVTKKMIDDIRSSVITFQKASAYRAAAQSIPTTAATRIDIDTDTFDPANITDLVNHRILPTIAGYYIVVGIVGLLVANLNFETLTLIYKNGAEVARGQRDMTGAGGVVVKIATGLVYLDGVDDYVELWFYQWSTGARDLEITITQNMLLLVGPF